MNKSENINDLFSVKKLNIVITGASRGIGFYLGRFLIQFRFKSFTARKVKKN